MANLLVRMIFPPCGNYWDWSTGVDVMRGNSEKVQKILADLHGLHANARRNHGPPKDDPIVGEVKAAPWTDAALRREPILSEQMRRHFAEVPHDAKPGEDFQRVIG